MNCPECESYDIDDLTCEVCQGVGEDVDGRWQLHIDDVESTPQRPRPFMWTY